MRYLIVLLSMYGFMDFGESELSNYFDTIRERIPVPSDLYVVELPSKAEQCTIVLVTSNSETCITETTETVTFFND